MEKISGISSPPYIPEKTANRVIDLYLSSGIVQPNKQRRGPPRKLSHHKDLLIFNAISIYLLPRVSVRRPNDIIPHR